MGMNVLTGILIGLVSEAGARHQRLWVYRRPLYPVLNVIVMFGLVMGSVAELAQAIGLAGAFGAGFAIGLSYELLNLTLLDWWYFPDGCLYMLRGKMACAAGVAVAWGAVPVAIAVVRGGT
jgi:hypothetical protein